MELKQEYFEAWLEAQPDDRVIDAADGSACFLCSFVGETTDIKHAQFTWNTWVGLPDLLNGPRNVVPSAIWANYERLPEWAIKLVNPSYFLNRGWNPTDCTLTCGEMKARYKQLFGKADPEIPALVQEPEKKLTGEPVPV